MKKNSIKNIALKYNLNDSILINKTKFYKGELSFTLNDGRMECIGINTTTAYEFILRAGIEVEKKMKEIAIKQKPPTTHKAVRDLGKSIKRTNRGTKKNKKSVTKK